MLLAISKMQKGCMALGGQAVRTTTGHSLRAPTVIKASCVSACNRPVDSTTSANGHHRRHNLTHPQLVDRGYLGLCAPDSTVAEYSSNCCWRDTRVACAPGARSANRCTALARLYLLAHMGKSQMSRPSSGSNACRWRAHGCNDCHSRRAAAAGRAPHTSGSRNRVSHATRPYLTAMRHPLATTSSIYTHKQAYSHHSPALRLRHLARSADHICAAREPIKQA